MSSEVINEDLQKFCLALMSPLQPVYDLVRERDDQKGWTVLLDPENCPVEFLPYLAQYVGVRPQPGWSESHLREEITQPSAWKRGTPEAIRLTAQRTLTGDKRVIMRERTPEPGCLYIRTLLKDTPDPSRVLADLRENVPAWIKIDYAAIEGVSLADLEAGWELLEDFEGAFTSLAKEEELLPSELPE